MNYVKAAIYYALLKYWAYLAGAMVLSYGYVHLIAQEPATGWLFITGSVVRVLGWLAIIVKLHAEFSED